MTKIIQAPALNHDAMMKKRFNVDVSVNGKLERRIIANLIAHMESKGWKVQGVHDGDDFTETPDMKAAMELIFNLDDAGLYFEKGDADYRVLLILGNGIDIISDWEYSVGDADGFNVAMEEFDAEDYA